MFDYSYWGFVAGLVFGVVGVIGLVYSILADRRHRLRLIEDFAALLLRPDVTGTLRLEIERRVEEYKKRPSPWSDPEARYGLGQIIVLVGFSSLISLSAAGFAFLPNLPLWVLVPGAVTTVVGVAISRRADREIKAKVRDRHKELKPKPVALTLSDHDFSEPPE